MCCKSAGYFVVGVLISIARCISCDCSPLFFLSPTLACFYVHASLVLTFARMLYRRALRCFFAWIPWRRRRFLRGGAVSGMYVGWRQALVTLPRRAWFLFVPGVAASQWPPSVDRRRCQGRFRIQQETCRPAASYAVTSEWGRGFSACVICLQKTSRVLSSTVARRPGVTRVRIVLRPGIVKYGRKPSLHSDACHLGNGLWVWQVYGANHKPILRWRARISVNFLGGLICPEVRRHRGRVACYYQPAFPGC
jgi:hypothetical protein